MYIYRPHRRYLTDSLAETKEFEKFWELLSEDNYKTD